MSGELGNAEEEANFAIILQGSDYAPYLERGDIRFRFHQNSKMIQALEGIKCSLIRLKKNIHTHKLRVNYFDL